MTFPVSQSVLESDALVVLDLCDCGVGPVPGFDKNISYYMAMIRKYGA